jgi:hypothetical protein
MNPMAIIQRAKQDGVTIALTADGIRATGSNEAVARWLPILREQKPVLASALLEAERQRIMRCMVEWHERAAIMTCGDLKPEQAELAAWCDLDLESIFFGHKKYH